MTEVNLLQTLVIGHIWQSVAVAAVLAGALIWGRRMRGATRYGLAGAAFLVCLVLPGAAFIPGETLTATLLQQLNAPVGAVKKSAAAVATPAPKAPIKVVRPQWAAAAIQNGAPVVAVDLGTQALQSIASDTTPVAETTWGKEAISNGAPEWALQLGATALKAALKPVAMPAAAAPVVAQHAPQAKTTFTLPAIALAEIKLPDVSEFALPLALVWAVGALILLARTGRDLIAVERLVARAKPAELPEVLKRRMGAVRVATSPDAPGPMAAGLFRPCIILPESIALGSPGMVALLEHERAHIERRDMLSALGQRITLALLWWSPGLHWISRRIDEEREVACDEAAVERTGDAKAFARSLTQQAENQLWARAPRLAVGVIGPRSQVGRRIKRLIELAKSGVSPAAKYSGRLAFAGLALAVGIAAMVTPRFTADAQQTAKASKLDGGPDEPIDITKPQDRDSLRDQAQGARDQVLEARDKAQKARHDARNAARDAARARGELDNFDPLAGLSDDDLKGLGEDIRELMKSVGVDLKVAFSDMSPEIDTQLQGLSGDLAALGVDISGAVSHQVLSDLPGILEDVQQTLKEQGIDAGDLKKFKGMSDVDREELRKNLAKVREQLHEQLGPEMKEQIRQSIEQARAEVASHRDEIAAAMKESQAGMAEARKAIEQARAEIEAARARGVFNRPDGAFNFEFKFDPAQLDAFKAIGRDSAKWNKNSIKWNEFSKFGGVDQDDTSANWRLMRAASRGEADKVKSLIRDEHADPNAHFMGDGTPLIEAARAGRADAAKALVEAGADPNRGSFGDGNPLIMAAAHSHTDVVKVLLGHGANPNGYVRGDETPLINAARKGDMAVVKLLVEHGANVNLAYRAEGWLRSPLNTAEKYGHDDVAAYLRSKGAEVEPKAAN